MMSMRAFRGRDLGSVAADIDKVVADLQQAICRLAIRSRLPARIQSMQGRLFVISPSASCSRPCLSTYSWSVNYQNFGDPFVLSFLALPVTLSGIPRDALSVTGTTLNVPSLMGAIMAVGVRVGELNPCWSPSPRRTTDGWLAGNSMPRITAGYTRNSTRCL